MHSSFIRGKLLRSPEGNIAYKPNYKTTDIQRRTYKSNFSANFQLEVFYLYFLGFKLSKRRHQWVSQSTISRLTTGL